MFWLDHFCDSEYFEKYLSLFSMSLKCTPLDDYVNRPDLTFQYTVTDIWDRDNYTIHNINLTSQTWLSGKCQHYNLVYQVNLISQACIAGIVNITTCLAGKLNITSLF